MPTITPFLWFDHEAQEAANYYVSIFPDGKVLGVSHYTAAGPNPKGTVMTVRFRIAGQEVVALNGGPGFPFSEAFSFVVNCKDQQEIDYYWDKLTADGGKAAPCGWLVDKFGFRWQIVPGTIFDEIIMAKDEKRTERVMRALLQMTKLDLATLQAAARG